MSKGATRGGGGGLAQNWGARPAGHCPPLGHSLGQPRALGRRPDLPARDRLPGRSERTPSDRSLSASCLPPGRSGRGRTQRGKSSRVTAGGCGFALAFCRSPEPLGRPPARAPARPANAAAARDPGGRACLGSRGTGRRPSGVTFAPRLSLPGDRSGSRFLGGARGPPPPRHQPAAGEPTRRGGAATGRRQLRAARPSPAFVQPR